MIRSEQFLIESAGKIDTMKNHIKITHAHKFLYYTYLFRNILIIYQVK